MDKDNPQERLEVRLGWLAGCFESDGWFSLNESHTRKGSRWYLPACGIVNTDRIYMEAVISILDELGVPYYAVVRDQKPSFGGKRPRLQITIGGLKRCARFLPIILPYLRSSKKKRAQLMLAFVEYRLTVPRCTPYSDFENGLYADLKKAMSVSAPRIPNDYTPSQVTSTGRYSLSSVETLRDGQK